MLRYKFALAPSLKIPCIILVHCRLLVCIFMCTAGNVPQAVFPAHLLHHFIHVICCYFEKWNKENKIAMNCVKVLINKSK